MRPSILAAASFRMLNSAKGLKKAREQKWIELRLKNDAAPSDPAEILMYEPIGRDPWDGSGLAAKDFKAVLDQVTPRGRELHIRINSKGGDVHEGMAMKTMLDEWPGKVTCSIDGVAASTASWIPMGCDEIRAAKNSQIFIHDAIAFGFGNAEDLRKAADNVDKTSDQIAGMYADKTGKGVRTMRQMMRDETLLTGEEAEELGLVDKLTDDRAVYNFTPDELLKMKEKLKAQNSAAGNKGAATTNCMNKKKVIAILNKHGVTAWEGKAISEETSDEHLEAALNQVLNAKQADADSEAAKAKAAKDAAAAGAPANNPSNAGEEKIIKLQQQIDQLTEANNSAKKLRITNEIEKLIEDDVIPATLKDKAIKRALGDEEYLNELQAMPSRPVGAAPLAASRLECSGDSFKDVQHFILENGPRFRQKFIGAGAANSIDKKVCLEIRDRAVSVANTWSKHRKMLTEMFNTNNIDAGLQRQIILQEMLEEFAVVLLPCTNFSTVFNNVPLEGTDEVDVPFYPLQAAGQAQSWDPATGYATFANTTTNTRPVLVGGGGVNSGVNAAVNTAKDRKFIGMAFSSYELARQPYLNVQKLAVQNANRLAVDIFTDIVSRVITAANFAATVKAVPAPAFTSGDVADLYGVATGRNWPARGRALVLDHTYNVSLLKDNAFKQYLAYGSTDPIRKAVIQQAYGFEDIPIVPNLSTYSPAGENLVGWINWLYAVLIATSPIMPTEEVRHLLTRYDVVVHPTLGVAFEYRRFGDTTLDLTKEVVECSYGANKGVASALARITSQ